MICSSGQRSAVAASLLSRLGAEQVIHVADGGVGTWERPGPPDRAESGTRDGSTPRAEASAWLSFLCVAESVDLNVICKNCGSEVSPYITECPYCGQRLRKRAPKLSRQDEGGEVELAPVTEEAVPPAPPRRERVERPLTWLSAQRPYATMALVLAGAVVYLVDQAGSLGFFDLGAIIGPLDGDWWRLVAAQFNYDNVGYLFAVGVAMAIFGTSLERRYSGLATLRDLPRLRARAGMYLATVVENFPRRDRRQRLGARPAGRVVRARPARPPRRLRHRERPARRRRRSRPCCSRCRCSTDRRTPGPASAASRSVRLLYRRC